MSGSVHILLLVALVAPACRSGAPVSEAAARDAAVRAVVQRSVERFNAHDGDGYLDLYAPDAVLVNVNGRRWRLPEDRPAVREVFHAGLSEAYMDAGDADVRFVRPDVALVGLPMTVGPFLLDDGRRRPPERQIGLLVLTDEGSGWRIRAFQNTRVVEP